MKLSIVTVLISVFIFMAIIFGIVLIVKYLIKYYMELKRGRTKRQEELDRMHIDDL